MKKVFKVKEGVLLAERNNILYVLDVDSGRVHEFNETARAIFQICMEPVSLEEIVKEYTQYFDIPESEAEKDISEVLTVMIENGLLEDGKGDANHH